MEAEVTALEQSLWVEKYKAKFYTDLLSDDVLYIQIESLTQ